MIVQHLYEQYGLSCHFERTTDGTWLRSGDFIIYPLPLTAFHDSSIEALAAVSHYLVEQGMPAARILKTQQDAYTTDYQGSSLAVLAVPIERETVPFNGETLARFHTETHMEQAVYSPGRPYLNWSAIWQSRADQTYSWMEQISKQKESSQFEEMALQAYPYFSGRAENAIQYVVDLVMDTPVEEGASFCHYRFPQGRISKKEESLIWPTEWVIDHPGRDVGEWIRTACQIGEPYEAIQEFINEYQKVRPITTVGASLAYARILFPLSFYETVEGYYSGSYNQGEALRRLEDVQLKSQTEENLLKALPSLGLNPIAKVDWL
ncbi:hypothetical protein PU629_05270 [Pullulanibacillus sp. KACC 23026]|uniref:hypothetical protein n=1 Tax=Pullulanibacillus sp. KACC 23026 TaxID=3028315 RepID=UPI0023B1D80E|nr:hypothetical protein [Pullulanibacillus sp. KACC 23026]WEG13778.1 hypothetical protein PU629_05270 [Pullulanibacillus sp. KACC 23026]